jgi:hypothetical protein
MKTQLIQNVFKMMIGVSALIASTAFFINTISPVQASENKETTVDIELPTNQGLNIPSGTLVGCGSGIYQMGGYGMGWSGWKKIGG